MRLSSSSCSLSLLCSCFQTLAKTPQNPKILLAIMAPKPVSSSISKSNNMSILSISSPPRPIIHKTFGYLTQLNLKSVGLGLNDIPYPFGWELMVYVGTIPCPIPSAACAGSSGLQDQFLENPETIVGDDSVPLDSQTGEKRKRVKMVARRTRTPRTRPQPRSRPSLTPSSPPSQPSRKSARIVFRSTPRSSKPPAP